MTIATPSVIPFVSVIVPCRNEARFIRRVIASILSSSYPHERLEAIFVDAMSTDGTRAILEDAARENPLIQVLENPRLIVPAAMNLGIRAARGDVIVRLDAHASYDRTYIPECVRLLQSRERVGSAGGRALTEPNGEGPWARAVAFVTAHRFGVGNSRFRTSDQAGVVDTVPYGTFWRRVLEEVGLYDERLTRNQDNELTARLQKAGYQIVYDPRIVLRYWNQAGVTGLSRQGLLTGMWNVYTLILHPYTWKARRFVPLCFVVYLAALVAAAWGRAWAGASWMGAACLPLLAYAILLAAVSLRAGAASGGALRVAATFLSYHLAYGVGPLLGALNVATGRWRAHLGRPLRL